VRSNVKVLRLAIKASLPLLISAGQRGIETSIFRVARVAQLTRLEESFAKLINQLWSAYSADVLGTVQRAQAKGLADILNQQAMPHQLV
jgi:hypothetical protein